MLVKDKRGGSRPFEQWVNGHFPISAKNEWEVNDCGEQWGYPGQKDFPICVDAFADVGGDHYSVSHTVGSAKLGLFGKPKLWWVLVKKNGKSEFGDRLEEFDEMIGSPETE